MSKTKEIVVDLSDTKIAHELELMLESDKHLAWADWLIVDAFDYLADVTLKIANSDLIGDRLSYGEGDNEVWPLCDLFYTVAVWSCDMSYKLELKWIRERLGT